MTAFRATQPRDLHAFSSSIEREGWAIAEHVVDELALSRVQDAIDPLVADSAERAGVRNLLNASVTVRAMAQSQELRALAMAVLGSECGAVRVIYFDKTPDANWRVVWHQDLSIAVASEHATPGYGPWTEKAGVVHVHAPAEVLEQMVALRVHLDDCDSENGPVRVLPGSHRSGRLRASDVDLWKARAEAEECHVRRGGVLAFRPLLLHASSPARTPRHRRVLHFEYAAAALAPGLRWHTWVGAPRA